MALLEIDDSDGVSMYEKLNERSELERFRSRHDASELQQFLDEYRKDWEPAFEENHAKFFDGDASSWPVHPWKVLKRERRRYAEEHDGDWPPMESRHALRVVKDEYVEKWEEARDSVDI